MLNEPIKSRRQLIYISSRLCSRLIKTTGKGVIMVEELLLARQLAKLSAMLLFLAT